MKIQKEKVKNVRIPPFLILNFDLIIQTNRIVRIYQLRTFSIAINYYMNNADLLGFVFV